MRVRLNLALGLFIAVLCGGRALASTYDQCLYALNGSATNGLSVDGSSTVSASTCGLIVDSSNSTALNVIGSSKITAKYIDVVGGDSITGASTVSPAPQIHSSAQADPLKFLVAPTSSHCDYTNLKISGSSATTLNPGTYCNGLTISGSANVTFNSGLYILMGGGLKVSGSNRLTGNGVTFFLTRGLSYNYSGLSVSGSSVMSLSAPTSISSPYYGILFYQDPSIPSGSSGSSISGSSNAKIEGVLYFPTTGLTFSGSSNDGSYLILVVDTLTVNGSCVIKLSFPTARSPLEPPVSVSLAPTAVTLYSSQTQQFTPTVTNSSQGLIWSLSPSGVGTLSTSGLYTAPASIATQQPVNVTATSQEDTTKSASATVTLMPPAQIPVLQSVAPGGAQQGANHVSVTITGNFTHFSATSIVTFANGAVTAGAPTAATLTSLTVPVSITTAASVGATNVTVTTGSEVVTLASGFTVTAGAPVITQVNPNSGQQGATSVPVTITGNFTHFNTSSVVTFANGAVTAGAPTAATTTSVTVPVSITAAATLGATNVTVTTGSEVVTLASGFTVTVGTPVLTLLNPNSAQQGASSVLVTITGNFTHFSTSSVVTFSNGAVTAGAPTAATATSVTVPVSITAAATLGATSVTVTTGSQVVTLANAFTVTAGAPVLTLLNPNSAPQGASSVPVTITGNFTHFTTSSVVTFANGAVTAGAPTAATTTSLTVPVSITAAATLGATGVTVTTGAEVATLANGFTVTAGAPVFTQVNPNTGQQGANHVSVTITGNFTHFSATSIVTFANGAVTAGAPTAATLTSLTVPVSITTAASVGATNVTVTTGSEVVTLASGFTVTAGAPVITQVNPNSGQQGATSVPVTITGNFTHFNTSSVVTFANGAVTAGAPTAATTTSVTVPVSITAAATLGATNVTVTTGSEVVTLASGFTVTVGTPVLTLLNPNSAQQGASSVLVTITGNFTHFSTSSVVTFSNGAVTAGAPTAATATSVTVPVSITAAATLGATSVTVTTGSQVVTLANAFTVTAGAPVLTLLNPNSAPQGASSVPVTITGNFTHFTTSSVVTFANGAVTAGAPTAATTTSLTVPVSITAAATLGATGVTVTTGAEVATLANGFTVTAGAPVFTQVNPNTGQQGANHVSVTITGNFTHFSATSIVTFANGAVTAGAPTAATLTSLTVPVSITTAASVGATNVTVTTGSEVVTLASGFTVTAGAPVITQVNPNSGQQGATSVPVTITGNFTHFNTSSVVTFANGAVTAGAPTAATTTSVTVPVSITAAATLGATNVTVTTGSEVVTLASGFTVTVGTPVITLLNPNSAQQGASSVPVTITGNFTHFSTSSVVTFANGAVTAGAPTAATLTSLTVPVSITAAATLGATSVTVTTGAELVTLTNAFTVTAGTPVITLLNPNSAQQGASSVPVTITGNFTHFSTSSVVTFANGAVTAAAPTAVTATSITVPVTISAVATLGATNVTVTTGAEVVTLSNALTVTLAPACVVTPSGLVSWWAGDGNTSDVLGLNNPSASNGVTFVPGEVGAGFTFGLGGYIDIPASASLANQQFTLSAWARPDGPGPTNDSYGSVIIVQDIDNLTTLSLDWRASDNRFLFYFGDVNSDVVASQHSFGPGQFYFVTGTYDGATFRLYVNGALEGQMASAKTLSYSTNAWTIGAASPDIRVQNFPRTWNGVIDEVQAFNRALSQAEIQGIYSTGSVGECKGPASIISAVPNAGQQGQQNVSLNITGNFTHFSNSSVVTFANKGVTAGTPLASAATTLSVPVSITAGAALGSTNVTVTTGAEVVTLSNGFTVTGSPVITLLSPNAGQQGASSVPVTITGNFTHFSASSVVTFSNGAVTAGAPTAATTTSVTVPVSITSTATLGTTSVTVTTGAEIVTLANGFTVTASVNQPPVVSGGPDQSIAYPNSANLNGSVTDDGLPLGGSLSSQWTLFSASGGPQSTWFESLPSGVAPLGRVAHTSIYIPSTNRLVVFGGYPLIGGVLYVNDLSTLTNANGLGPTAPAWIQEIPNGAAGSPAARAGASAVYDPSSNQVILYGGLSNSLSSALNDVWMLANPDGGGGTPQWTLASIPGPSPPARWDHIAAYNRNSNRMIVYGGLPNYAAGLAPGGPILTDLWVLTNVNGLGGTRIWSQLNPVGTPPVSREGAFVAYDDVDDRLIIFGGAKLTGDSNIWQTLNDTWILSNATGSSGTPTWTQLSTNHVPTPRDGGTASYDAISNEVVIFGGSLVSGNEVAADVLNETWILTGANGLSGQADWQQVNLSSSPNPREGSTATFDEVNNRIIIFGGQFAPGPPSTNETWVLNSAASRPLSATFGNSMVPITTATFSSPGSYTLRLTGNDSQLSAFSDTHVKVLAPNGAPQVSAGQNQTISISAAVTLTGVYSDDGLPIGGGLTITWSEVSGPGAATFGNSSAASTTATFSQPGTYVLRLTVSDSKLAGSSDVTITVNPGVPVITSVIPNTGPQGQQNLSVNITGQSTNWVQGTTQASFGSGISVVSLTVSTPTSATAVINIGSAATIAAYNVTLTTGSEIETLTNGFTVTASTPIPMITSVSPNAGPQGQGGPVAIIGQNTHFVQGTTQVSFGPGITVSNVAVTCPTCLTAQLLISATAATGPVTVKVTTGSEIATLSNGFTIQPGTPILTSLNPASEQQGQTLTGVAITGQFTHFTQGTTQVSFGAGITVSNIAVSSTTSLTAQLVIAANATVGAYTLTVTTGSEVVSVPNVFNVQAASPSLTVNAGANQTINQTWNLLVSNYNSNATTQPANDVLSYNGATGASLGTFADTVSAGVLAPYWISYGPDGNIYLSSADIQHPTGNANDKISRFSGTTGAFINTFAPQGYGGSFTFGPDGNLYVVDAGIDNTIKSFNGSTGAFLGAFASGFTAAAGMVFGPDGSLYVADANRIAKVNGQTGANLGSFTVPGAGGLSEATGLIFGPDGDLYVSDLDNANVLHFDGNTGAFKGTFVARGSGGLTRIGPIAFGPDGDFYVGAVPVNNTGFVTRYNGQTGAFIDTFVPNTGGGLLDAFGLMFQFQPITTTLSGSVTATGFTASPVVTWTQVSGPGTVSFANPNSLNTAATFSIPGTYVLSLAATDSGQTASGNVTITALTPNKPPTVSAGPPQNVVSGAIVTLAGTISDDGLPSPHVLTASWSLVSGPGTVLVGNANFPSTTATFSAPGSYVLNLSASDGMLTSSANVTITVTTPTTPTISSVIPNAGSQGQQNLSVAIAGQLTHWVQGTSTANFGAGITVATLTINSATSATAVLDIAPTATLGASNVTVTTGAEVATLANGFTVTAGTPVITQVNPNTGRQNQQNLAIAITGQFTNFAQGTSQVSFGGAGVTVNSVTVTDATHLTANISIALSALLGARPVTVTTGTQVATLSNAFSVTVALNQAPVISISPTWADTLPNQLTITYTVTDDGLPLGGTLTVSWQTISGPGTVGYQNQTPTSIVANFSQAGTYVLQVSANDTQLTTTQNVTVTVTGSLAPPPTVSIGAPADGSEITTVTSVTGTVSSSALASWTLDYQTTGETLFHTLATGTTPVLNGPLGTFDPTLLLNGITYLRLSATDTSNQTSTTTISLVLTRNQKVGNFTVSFNDLSVPVAGLPIQVVRTYDSRRRGFAGSDFSYGWTLGINAVEVAESVPLGSQWTETSSGGAFPTYCVQAVSAHVVTVTLQDGTTYEFTPTLNPSCQSLVPIQTQQITVTFAPTGATPPNASLALAAGGQPYVVGSVPGPVTLTDGDLITTFDPDLYILTLPDGRTLQLSMQSGLQKMTDLNGNTLTVTSAGITSSTGKSVAFTRNAANLITQITDPAGNKINYAYSPTTGDLTGVTDRSGNTTTFTYDTNHYLLTIVDPLGVQPIKNVYDNSGRLIQHIDAYGNVISYTNNVSANQEAVMDRLGNLTVNNYDADGNIVQVTDALGGVTNRTYDGNDNILTETNALGETRTYTYDANNNRLTETDPLHNTTTYTYNARNQVLTVVDPLGHTTTNIYDPNGNLLSTKDPATNVTSYVYNAAGLRTSMTDALGNVTNYQYDSSGNLTQQTDPLGHITTNTYDANGNRLSETRTRTTSSGTQTLVTNYQYDASSRLTQTTYADGSTTHIQYNAIGKQGVTIDQLARQTSYQYDLMGRLTQTTYPDATNESSTYDAEGDRIGSTDRGGRTTTYKYDSLKRLTLTMYADTTTAGTSYDAISEVTAVTDPRGNVTHYGYDTAGRRISVTDALTHLTSLMYDAAGNQVSMTDANGNTTQYQYDNDNRRTRVTYPDASFDSTAYDALGRTTSKTDQAGANTQFQYDKLGRLTQVTDALSHNTTYAYDEVGNRVSQTDANGHTTAFAYDQLGRRIQRTLPVGMLETMTYDAAGNLKTKTDFNGKTTTYNYDAVNRLTSKAPDASFGGPTVSFTYTATSQRQMMTDASGTTNYTYDLRDHLTQRTTPEGTLSYGYDPAGNLLSIGSSNTGGTSVNYTYDVLNRLSMVRDNRLTSGTTTYAYDKAGNLQNYLYPNGVQTGYMYNTLNRLTNVTLATSTTLASYAYTLGAAGNRTQVIELGGRQVNYTYDALYRLTGETIAGGSVNGTIGYQYDAVGNRLQRTSSVTPIPAATSSYDANDRLTTDTYDQDGNTIASGGTTYAFDFENHLQTQNGSAVTIVYDGDGNRVSKTVAGVTTKYLVDDRNLMGYAQVLEEISGGSVQRVYTYGLNRISESQASGISFYGYDGQGSVRLMTDTTGAVTDRYDYDAFGGEIGSTGSTFNSYLYSGEQNDPNLGIYYLRARYLKQSTGRFQTADPLLELPFTLEAQDAYGYASNDPTDRSDPSGLYSLADATSVIAIMPVLAFPSLIGPRGVTSALERALGTEETPIHAFHYLNFNKLNGVVSRFGLIPVTQTNDCVPLVGKSECAFFTPTPFLDAATAKDQLQLPSLPDHVISLNLFKQKDQVSDTRKVSGNSKWGSGGGWEFATPYGVFLYEPNRNPIFSTIH